MKKQGILLLVVVCVILSSGITFVCINEQKNREIQKVKEQYESPPPIITLADRYSYAVLDAMVVTDEEVVDTLTPIINTNPDLLWENDRVLVVTWTRYGDSYPVGNTTITWWGDTWVTVVPELKDRIEELNISPESLTLRVEQLLGLPNGSSNSWFVELWVNPDDLFRPSPDPEINDTVAMLNFPENVSIEYKAWFNGMIISQYFQEKKYPWTRLGYTYDWGNPETEVGISEFMIRKNSEVVVHSKSMTQDYFSI
jgi:hypothetical protein